MTITGGYRPSIAACRRSPRMTSRCLAERLGRSYTTVETHLYELDKTWKYGVWIPHELSPYQLQCRIDVCMDLTTSHRNHEWLRNLITADEKWVSYINYARRRQWLSVGQMGVTTPKTDPHPQGDAEHAVGSQRGYSSGSSSEWLQHHHGNAKPHIAKSTCEKLLKLGWIMVPHPPYSPDFVPRDFPLFHSLSDYLGE